MNIQIQTPHLKSRDALNDLIIDRLENAFGMYPYVTNCKVFLKVEKKAGKDACETEVYLHLSHKELFASAKGETFEDTLSPVIEKLKRQLERYKEKVYIKP